MIQTGDQADFEDNQVVRPRDRAGKVEGASTFTQNIQNMDNTDVMMGEQEMLSASANANFNLHKAEQRTLLETRNQTLKRIEAMRREYDFIQNLDAKDVNYVMEKKKEHAALIVQRNWRRMKAEREYNRARQGMSRENHEYEKTEADMKRMVDNQEELRMVSEHLK